MEIINSSANAIELVTGDKGDKVDACVIWLHGLGSDGNDFIPIAEELRLPAGIRFIFPHAPMRPITLNMGYMMRGWYDLASLRLTDGEDSSGIQNSVAVVQDMLNKQAAAGIPTEKIVLAGFSQGGAIALYAGLTYPKPLAGIMALSTYIPLADTLKLEETNPKLPILMVHGTQDDIVNYKYGQQSSEKLKTAGYPVEWHEFPMTHSVCAEEVDVIREWLKKVLHV